MLTQRSNLDFLPKWNITRRDTDTSDSIFYQLPSGLSYYSDKETGENGLQSKVDDYYSLCIYPNYTQSKPEIQVELDSNGDIVLIPLRLKDVAEAINEAKCILAYEEDWDDNEANATDQETFKKAVNFLVSYSKELLKFGIIAKPFIDIMRDGAISIFWETDKATLLIIFNKNSSKFSYFYGEVKGQKIPFRYAIENGKEPDEIVTLWMRRNLI